MDRELLLELGTEELPASWLPGLTRQIRDGLDGALRAHRLPADAPVESYSTPRRLTARIAKIAERQNDLEELLTGHPVAAAFAADGQPTPAAVGFARKNNVDVNLLERIDTPKGTYLGYRRHQRGKAAGMCFPMCWRQAPRLQLPKAHRTRIWRTAKGGPSGRPFGGSLSVWRSRGAVHDSPDRAFRVGGGAGSRFRGGHLRAPLPDDQRTRRAGRQGAYVRRLSVAARRTLRRPRQAGTAGSDCSSAGIEGAQPRRPGAPRSPRGGRRRGPSPA